MFLWLTRYLRSQRSWILDGNVNEPQTVDDTIKVALVVDDIQITMEIGIVLVVLIYVHAFCEKLGLVCALLVI